MERSPPGKTEWKTFKMKAHSIRTIFSGGGQSLPLGRRQILILSYGSQIRSGTIYLPIPPRSFHIQKERFFLLLLPEQYVQHVWCQNVETSLPQLVLNYRTYRCILDGPD